MHSVETITWRAIHRQVLIVTVSHAPVGELDDGWAGDWKSYVVPVPGLDHDSEARDLWAQRGTQLSEREARALCPWLAADFDAAGLLWRR
jgi:hypothetical protein